MYPQNYNNYYYQPPYFHPHGQYLPYNYPNLIPIYGPNAFPHPWPHYFPPYIPQHNYYQQINANNRNYINNINNNGNNNINSNNSNNNERGNYIPQDDDYDYSELYDFGNHREEEKKEEEINPNEIKIEPEHNSQDNMDNIALNLKKSEINQLLENQENNINNPNDINLRDSQFNNNDFYLLKHSLLNKENENDYINDGNNIENSININKNNNNIEHNIDNNNNEIIIESNHEHPLIYVNNLNESCTICHQINKENSGYNCKQCPLILCIKCAERVFNKNKKISIHPHPLLLKLKNDWKCNICEINFKDTSSFSCDKCGFNICSFCLV